MLATCKDLSKFKDTSGETTFWCQPSTTMEIRLSPSDETLLLNSEKTSMKSYLNLYNYLPFYFRMSLIATSTSNDRGWVSQQILTICTTNIEMCKFPRVILELDIIRYIYLFSRKRKNNSLMIHFAFRHSLWWESKKENKTNQYNSNNSISMIK